jgi:hypothetical protein
LITYYGRGTWEQKLENTHSCATPSITSHQWLGNQYQIQWSGTGMSFDIQYRPEAEMNWNTLNITGNNFLFSQYQGCTRYELRVRAHCGNDSSLWSQRIYFETPSNQLNNDFDNHQDIGNTGAAGSVCFDSINQRYTIYAAGDDIWGSADHLMQVQAITRILPEPLPDGLNWKEPEMCLKHISPPMEVTGNYSTPRPLQ